MTMVLLLAGSQAIAQNIEKVPEQKENSESWAPGKAVVMRKPVVCGTRNDLIEYVTEEHGEEPVMGWVDGKTGEPVMFFYNYETKSSSIMEVLPSVGLPENSAVYACFISGGSGFYVSKKFLEHKLGVKL